MSGLPREVLKWLQSLDLTWQVKTPKWDLTNGYLVAEVFSWYYPQEIQMHMFNNGTSLDSKLRNWSLLKNFIKSHKLDVPEELVEGTIHCKEGAAQILIQKVYELFTLRELRVMPRDESIDFTDRAYQVQLPLYARSTASQAIKNNLRITELMADKNLILGQQKAQQILNEHIDHRMKERVDHPNRFDKKPTLGELAARIPPLRSPVREPTTESELTGGKGDSKPKSSQSRGSATNKQGVSPTASKEPVVTFKEVKVKQLTSQQAISSY